MKLLAVSALMMMAFVVPTLAAGDATAGATVFKKCAACHAVGEGAKNKVGPELNELFGRAAGSIEGYSYSKAVKEAGAGGLVWTEATLAEWIHKPKAFIAGTKMSFAGIEDPVAVENLLAYLLTFSPNYTPAQ
jgi:cytochrome c